LAAFSANPESLFPRPEAVLWLVRHTRGEMRARHAIIV
jgi:hypothetical protein